ncbi:hypothetical protein SISSUDRAFT_1060804 [Sistotremastrum suecicum HHB10207 ss-3]|uniref:T6SS Phospholipase effector Tle1-like catalytic domain-containing protein n=1 Tax=Sistotremastrum suecicum HHB10207 ss-3 TaxID=1314776 RepID=A0A166ES77_9AGAM|nr:hypothetical protein SISSUDRAFT_1060804 [Sistotremastrum suecicum HHB10207 ss-3]
MSVLPPANGEAVDPLIRPKSLVIFCDGSMDDGLVSRSDSSDAPDNSSSFFSNILRISRSVRPYSKYDGVIKDQIVYYQSGIGSEADFYNKDSDVDTFLAAFGTAVASKIRDVYAFIAQNYRPGDDICLFGFSRGAYTARKVSGLIQKIGLLSNEQMGSFYSYWQYLSDPTNPLNGTPPPPPASVIPIKLVACFDTVGSVWLGLKDQVIDSLSIKDNSLVPNVRVALHALSIHENRDRFMCTQWDESTKLPNQIVRQVFFAGAHSDVGGGYEVHELSDVSLFWMVDQITSLKLLDLDLDFIANCRQYRGSKKPDWGTSQPHNSYHDTEFLEKLIMHPETRLKGGQFVKAPVFHPSVALSPKKLDEPGSMITLDDIVKSFGKDWKPTYTTLGDFEKRMKSLWDTDPSEDQSLPQPSFEKRVQILPMVTGGVSAKKFRHRTRTVVSEIPNLFKAIGDGCKIL